MGNACISNRETTIKSSNSNAGKSFKKVTFDIPSNSHDESIFEEFTQSMKQAEQGPGESSSANGSENKPLITKNIQFKWSEEYMLGVLFVDRQHKRLVELIIDLNQVSVKVSKAQQGHNFRWDIERILDELFQYTKIHFFEEEAMMSWYQYPWIKAHKKVHADFVRKVDEARKQFSSSEGAMEVTDKLSLFLQEWLVSHILRIDKRLVEFVTEKNPKLKNSKTFTV